MNKRAFVLSLFLTGIAVSSCASQAGAYDEGEGCVQGSGTRKSEERSLSTFSEIDVSGAFRVEAVAKKSQRFEISGDDNILPHITTEVEGERLVVGIDEGICPKTELVIEIDAETLRGVSARGAQSVRVTAIDAPEFRVEAAGTAETTLAGRTGKLHAELAGAGALDAEELQAEQVEISISGSGEADVYASKRLAASIMGVGTIRYYGHPAEVERNILGLGSLIEK